LGSESLRETIRKILVDEETSEKGKLMACTLRVLSLYNGVLWFREIVNEIKSFILTVEGEEKCMKINHKVLNDAIEELKRLGIVGYTIRLRSLFNMSRPVEEPLVRLVDLPSTLNTLMMIDEKFRRYIVEREKALESIRKVRKFEDE